MNALHDMNIAMNYIEKHLTEELDIKKVSGLAGCSEYHFRRMFSFLSGFTITEYIRFRRLALAASDLHDTKEKVIDIAIKYGYESSDSFSRAFSNFHGVHPSEVRSPNVNLKAFPPMSFSMTIKGGVEMNYRMVRKEAFQIAGIKKQITLVYEGVNHQMDDMWTRFTEQDFVELKSLSNIEPQGILCVSAHFSEKREEGTQLDQYIGVATTMKIPERWEILPVEAGTWAVFTAIGEFPNALQQVWAQIYSEWFPSSDYELTGGPELLWNESKDTGKPEYRSEIWIPVSIKEQEQVDHR